MKQKNNLGFGVYYRDSDYAGFFRRIAVVLIDLSFLLLLSFLVFWILELLNYPLLNTREESMDIFTLEILLLLSFIYLSIIKPSRLRTLGYIFMGVKIVDLKGQRPSFFKMAFRYILLIVGPLSLIPDIVWLLSEKTKQTFLDKVSGTYVIKKNAEPIGTGILAMKYYHITGLHIIALEVKKDGAETVI